MEYRLIALDLDGTLLGTQKQISPRNRRALAAARERGLLTVIATGRSPHSAREFSHQVAGGPVICCNGAAILDEAGEYLLTKGMATAPLLRAIELCAANGLLAECYTTRGIVMDRLLAHAVAYYRWVRQRVSVPMALFQIVRLWHVNRMKPVRSLRRWAEQPGIPPVLKLMIFGPEERLRAVAAQLRHDVPGLAVTSSGSGNLEVNAAGVSKGAALELLGARLQIPRQAMIAMGDSDNDLEMLAYAGLGVAMGNAEARIKKAADRVTATCDQDGVAMLLEELSLAPGGSPSGTGEGR